MRLTGWLDWTNPDHHELVAGVWPDVALLDDVVATAVLQAAREQCEHYAPAAPSEVPDRYRHAQALQARSISQAGIVQQGADLGGGFPVSVFPMDWSVKALLRPPGRPRVG